MVNNIINLLNVVLHFGFTILFSKWAKKKTKNKRKQNKKSKTMEKKRDSCRWKTSSEVEIKRNRLNKEIKDFIGHLMAIIMKKLSM